ncbi:MAG: hypothetical protein JO127_16720 [Caulobacteraceae bacterium]|nr:hypothetical protein [Caulobacteraceae bacterium]
MNLKPGSRWKSSVCTAEVVVVKPPKGEVSLECGGASMVALSEQKPEGLAVDPAHASGVQTGKRYFDEETGIEVLGSKPGAGSLAVNGRPLQLREAKALPASD